MKMWKIVARVWGEHFMRHGSVTHASRECHACVTGEHFGRHGSKQTNLKLHPWKNSSIHDLKHKSEKKYAISGFCCNTWILSTLGFGLSQKSCHWNVTQHIFFHWQRLPQIQRNQCPSWLAYTHAHTHTHIHAHTHTHTHGPSTWPNARPRPHKIGRAHVWTPVTL